MKNFRFYHPDTDGDSGADKNTKVTYKFEGEDGSFDISDPAQAAEAKKFIELGKLHTRDMPEIGKLREKAQNFDVWDQLIRQSAETGNTDVLMATLSDAGIKMTKGEKEEFSDLENDDAVKMIFDKLDKKISGLENKIDSSYWAGKGESAHTKLSSKYNGNDGLPKYKPEEIEKYCQKKKFIMDDIEEQYDVAYQMMNREAIETAKDEARLNKNGELKRKRDKVKLGDDDAVAVLRKDKRIDLTGKNYDQIAKEAGKILEERGEVLDLE